MAKSYNSCSLPLPGRQAIKEGKCRDLTCHLKADKISFVYHTNQTKKMKRNKSKIEKQLSPEMIIKIREISPKR